MIPVERFLVGTARRGPGDRYVGRKGRRRIQVWRRVHAGLTGPVPGLFEEAAVRLAVEQFMKGDCIVEAIPAQPCEGGGLKIGGKKIPIEWKAYDDVSEDKKSIDAVTRLVEQDGARAIWACA
jgi:hypothetical protein